MQILDNLLEPLDFALMYPHFASKGFNFKHRSNSTKQTPHQAQFAYYCKEEDRNIVTKVTSKVGLNDYKRAYVQLYTPSTVTYTHQDITNDTLLFFFHPFYEYDWGGEFIVYDNEVEGVGTSIAPLKNRLIRFDGAKYKHTGKPFNSLASCYRMVLVINA